MLLQNRLNQVNTQIANYLEQIAALQSKVTSLQAHAQEIQGAEQAAESALSQIDTAISMLNAICPDELATFKAAIDAKFAPAVPQISGADDVVDIQEDDTSFDGVDSDPGSNPGNGVDASEDEVCSDFPGYIPDASLHGIIIDTTAEAVEDVEEAGDMPSDDVVPDADNGNGNGHHLLTYADLKLVNRPTLIKLANLHQLGNCKQKKRDELAQMLDGMVTGNDLVKASNGKHG